MSLRTLRLLHLIQRYFPFQGGSERYFQSVSEWFAARGDVVDVLTTDAWDLEYFWDPSARHSQPPETMHEGVRVTRVPVRHLPVARLSHRAIRRLMAESCRASFPGQLRLLRTGSRFGPWLPGLEAVATELGARADLINSANIAFESMITIAERVARSNDAAHVVTPFVHLGEDRSSKVRRYYTMPHQIELLRRADGVIALTALERDTLVELGVDGDRIYIAGAGIDRARSTGGDAVRARAALGEARPLVLALGAAAFDKGTMHLVEAVSRLNRSGFEVALIVAGPILQEFRRFVDELSEQDRRNIHVLGFVSDDEKRDLLAAADMLALPSRTESFGLVFLEGWANGKPVIGARAGAIPSVVSDGEDGLLVPFGDVPALSDAIRTLVEDAGLRERLGQRGQAKVVDEAEWLERVEAIYRTVLGADESDLQAAPLARGRLETR